MNNYQLKLTASGSKERIVWSLRKVLEMIELTHDATPVDQSWSIVAKDEDWNITCTPLRVNEDAEEYMHHLQQIEEEERGKQSLFEQHDL